VRHAITSGSVVSDSGPARRAARSKDLTERFALRHSSSYHAFDGRRRRVTVLTGTVEQCGNGVVVQLYQSVTVERRPLLPVTQRRCYVVGLEHVSIK